MNTAKMAQAVCWQYFRLDQFATDSKISLDEGRGLVPRTEYVLDSRQEAASAKIVLGVKGP